MSRTFASAYPHVEPQAVLASMEEGRYSESVDGTLTYLRQLACLIDSNAVATAPMKFYVCDQQKRSLSTDDPRQELVWRTLSIADSGSDLTSDQCKTVIGLLQVHLARTASSGPDVDGIVPRRVVEAAYLRMRAQCLWLKIRGMIDGEEPVDQRVIGWSSMVRVAMRLPEAYSLAAHGLVAHATGQWSKAAHYWSRARNDHRHALTPEQEKFLARYEAGIYEQTPDSAPEAQHVSVDPLHSPSNTLYRMGNNPLKQCTFVVGQPPVVAE